MSAVVASACSLLEATGRSDSCQGSGCPFWEEGRGILPTGCVLERILPPADWTPELAERWLRLRQQFRRESRSVMRMQSQHRR